jgi:lysophospholipase L1-like esterase
VSPDNGTTPSGNITVTVNSNALAAGSYSATLTATAAGYVSDTINVSLSVMGDLLITDDFSSDSGNWLGVNSTRNTANWQVSGGLFRQTVDSTGGATANAAYAEGTYAYLTTQPSLQDFEFAVDIYPQAAGLNQRGEDVGIIFRHVDGNNFYRFAVNSKYGYTRLERRIGGSFSTMAVTAQGYRFGQVLRLGVRISGNVILVYKDQGGAGSVLDNEPYLAAYDSALSQGSVALYTQSSADFDNVIIRSVSGAPHIGLAAPAETTVSTSTNVAVSAVVLDGNGSESVSFEIDGSTCSAVTNPQPGLFESTCDAVFAREAAIAAILSDPGEIDRDSSIATGAGGDILLALGNSVTNGTGDAYIPDNTSIPIVVNGLDTVSRQIAYRGYQAGLHDALTSDATYTQPNIVFNEGVPGDRSDELTFDRLPSILERHPDASRALVMIGTNDAYQAATASGLNCAGAACDGTLKGNLLTAVATLQSAGVEPVLARIPPFFGFPLSASPYSDPLSGAKNLTVIEYNQAIGQVEQEEGLASGPDFFDEFLAGGDNRYSMFADHLHPNALGIELMRHTWSENIAPGSSQAPLIFDALCIRSTSSNCEAPTSYKQNFRQVGDQYYVDRSYTLTSIPSVLDGGTWLTTANDHKSNSRDNYITFTLNADAMVYIAFMPGVSSLPNWMSSFSPTGDSIGVTAGTPSLDLYSASFTAGSAVTLGGILATGAVGPINNNLVVILVPL